MLPITKRRSTPILFGLIPSLLLLLAAFVAVPASNAQTLDATAALNSTSNGFRVNEGGSGAIDLGWTGGNLGNLWVEGEWVPYQLILRNVQSEYPDLTDLPDIKVSFDFTKSGARFVDLVRGIQVGQQALTDDQAWPNDAGQPYPMTTKSEIKAAQNDVGNTAPLENEWQLGGAGDFQLLSLPNTQVNRAVDGSAGTTTEERRIFTITKSDLLAAGIPADANTIVVYYQLHESRSFVWGNALQAALANSPTDAWGGYLYDDAGFATDQRPGSSQVPGSSGHVHLESLGGSQDVPIPIPQGIPGAVAGLKWQDDNGDGLFNNGEPTLSGWRITVSGLVDNILFSASMLTDDMGIYSFPNLTNGTWTITEASSREVPANINFSETYPNAGSAPVGVGTRVAINQAGQAAWGWSAVLTDQVVNQGGLNFGNRGCIDVGTSTLVSQTLCPGGTTVFSTTATGTGPFSFVWKKGANILSTGGNITISTNGASSMLTITGVSAADIATYSVTVSGECGPDAMSSTPLALNENVSAANLADQQLCPGANAVFSTTASGTGPFVFVWKKGANVLSTGGNITIATNGATSSLTISGVSAADVATYSVTVSGACGDPVVKTATLTVNQAAQSTDLVNQSVCPGETAAFTTTASGTGPFGFVWKKGMAVLATGGDITITTNGSTSTLSIANVEAADAGTYSVTVSGACGDPVVKTATLQVNDAVTTTALTEQTLCEGGTASFNTTASGSGPFVFVWKKGATVLSTGGKVTITTVENMSTLSITNVTPGDAGTYSVMVSGACGTPAVRTAPLVVNANVSATGLRNRTFCDDSEGKLSVTASGTGPFEFVWRKGDVILMNGGNLTITTVGNMSMLAFNPTSLDDGGHYSVTVSGLCGPPVVLGADLTISDCVEFCSLTQGYWGNTGGKKCYEGRKLGTTAILEALITPGNPLIVGKPGRSLTVNDGSESCIIKRLPGGGPSIALPTNFGNVTMTANSCMVPPEILKNGKFNNTLLSQTIALDLNLRYNKTLSSFQLCSSFVTVKALAGADGCLGSSDDRPNPDDPGTTFTIDSSVLTALTTAGLPRTPAGLLALANCGLAGQSTFGASLPLLTGAAGAINEGFDDCRFIISCTNDAPGSIARNSRSSLEILETDTPVAADAAPARFELLANHPNPFSGATTIRFALPERSRVTITLFNLAGQKLTIIADEEFQAGYRTVEWDAGSVESTRSSGIYFYRIEGAGLDSGQRFAKTGKMIIVH